MSSCNCNCYHPTQYNTNNRTKSVGTLIVWILIVFLIVFFIGVIGFIYIFDMDLSDAFYNAAITTSTLGIEIREKNTKQKIFLGIYALISGVLFISLVSAFISHIVEVYHD